MTDTIGEAIFELSPEAQQALDRYIPLHTLQFAYENITHEEFDVEGKPEFTLHRLYCFTMEKGTLMYSVSKFEETYTAKDVRTYPKPEGVPFFTLDSAYMQKVIQRIETYFAYHLEYIVVQMILTKLRTIYENVTVVTQS